MVTMINLKAEHFRTVNRLKSDRSVILITTPPTVTELQHAISSRTPDLAPNLIGKLFKSYGLGIETSNNDDSIFSEWSNLSTRDHKSKRFDYADFYLYKVARELRAQFIVTIDRGFGVLIAKEKKTVKFDLAVINLSEQPDEE